MKFLVDANLPRKFTWFNTADFSFAHDWGDAYPDKEIWDYALQNNLVILTRDSDYFHWIIQSKTAPKVIYFKLQQQGRKELEIYFAQHWRQICQLIETHRMVIATVDTLEVF
jgi:predicted nuclease of predicted toxin-antitoxin system